MPSAFAHALVGFTIAKVILPKKSPRGLYVWSALLSAAPDLDVLAFRFKIPYGAPLGHRGFSHSLLFALGFALIFSFIKYRKNLELRGKIIPIFFLSLASHGFLDAFTNGGLGVGFFIPVDNARYFFPWRPIAVSPIGIGHFFTRGLHVLKSEVIWIGIPCVLILLVRSLVPPLRR